MIFQKFLDSKLNEVAPGGPPSAPLGGGGIGGPGSLPPGGGAPPPMGGGMPGAPGGGGGTAPNKLKAYNVWDVLERVLSDGQS